MLSSCSCSCSAPPENLLIVWPVMQTVGWGQYFGITCKEYPGISLSLFQVMVWEVEKTLSPVWSAPPPDLAGYQTFQTAGESHGQTSCAAVLACQAPDQGRLLALPLLHEDRVHVLDLVPPSVPVMWLLTMGGGEGCHTVKVVVRPVQTRGLVWPLDTWQQGWSLHSP